MANTKSAIKRLRSSERRRVRNRVVRGSARTAVKKVRSFIDDADVDGAREALRVAVKALDKAAQKGVIHKNNAARRKARLMKQFNSMESVQE